MTKILLVEDDKSLREIYGVRLLAEGYDIVSAGDGEEALAMAIKERPALIVSDVMMPKISGFDMLDILRSTTETKNIKVIIMTALSSEDQRLRGEQLGADRYLVKSQVGIEDVVRAVHDVLGDAPETAASTTAELANTTPDNKPALPTVAPPEQAAPPEQLPEPAPQLASSLPPVTSPAPRSIPTTPEQLPEPASLPHPTAPFSSNTPRPNSLGDRIIQPLPHPEKGDEPDVKQLIDQELREFNPEPAPEETPLVDTSDSAPDDNTTSATDEITPKIDAATSDTVVPIDEPSGDDLAQLNSLMTNNPLQPQAPADTTGEYLETLLPTTPTNALPQQPPQPVSDNLTSTGGYSTTRPDLTDNQPEVDSQAANNTNTTTPVEPQSAINHVPLR